MAGKKIKWGIREAEGKREGKRKGKRGGEREGKREGKGTEKGKREGKGKGKGKKGKGKGKKSYGIRSIQIITEFFKKKVVQVRFKNSYLTRIFFCFVKFTDRSTS